MDTPNQGYIMEFMTVREMREALSKTRTVILPMGVIEQHGYHLPLNTDVYNCYEIAKRVAPVAGCVVAPPIMYSFSGGELPGTTDISPQTLSLLTMDIIKSLANQGFRNIIILLGHGGSENQQAALDAADMFYRRNVRYRDVRLATVTFTDLTPSVKECFAAKDFHAGYLETSLMLYWHPELVRPKELWVTDTPELMDLFRRDQDAYQTRTKLVNHPLVVPIVTQNPDTKVGVMGDPSNANAEFGRKVCQEAVAGLVELIRTMEGAD
ncbi:MAG: creatininase family protein [Anaerolineae bacterium]|nr:creatininase family protein [Anaerolineae bacterium]